VIPVGNERAAEKDLLFIRIDLGKSQLAASYRSEKELADVFRSD
jgi:hypothetical protein